MQAYVFTDKSLERYAGQFVWLSMDVEKATSASFRKRFGVQALPSFFIVDPSSEKVTFRLVGGATVAQMRKIFDDGSVTKREQPLQKALARADQLYGEGKNSEAAAAYQEALRIAPKGWSRLGRTTESLLFALTFSDQYETCARVARDSYPKILGSESSANVAALGLDCALSLEPSNSWRSELVKLGELRVRDVLDNQKIRIAGDDRSGLYQTLISARSDVKDAEGEARLIGEWSAFLDAEAAKAKTPEARAVYDSHRLSAYIALEKPELAIPMLEQSERDFPDDYNPPARLSVAYKEMKKFDEALAANDRALTKAYGPRTILIYRNRADVYLAKGDLDEARKTLTEAIAIASALPEGQRSEQTIESLKKKLEGVKQ